MPDTGTPFNAWADAMNFGGGGGFPWNLPDNVQTGDGQGSESFAYIMLQAAQGSAYHINILLGNVLELGPKGQQYFGDEESAIVNHFFGMMIWGSDFTYSDAWQRYWYG